MTTAGWIMLVAAWGGIVGLTLWCIIRVLRSPWKG
jgi:hypothetical protein